jgi:hypothetical protein
MRSLPAFLLVLPVLPVLLSAAPASAQDSIAIAGESPPKKPLERRIDTRLGLLTGGSDVGDVTGASTGLHASLGYRLGAVTLMGEYGYYGVGDNPDEPGNRDGKMTRAGVTARMQIADVAKPGSPVGLEFWAEGGVGTERIAWSEGGKLYRPDVALGFGFEVDGRGWRQPRPRHIGADVGFRAVVARAPDSDLPAMCEGPCTVATPPSRNDVSLYFHFGLHWGR